MSSFLLGRHRIEPGGRCFVIGEVALAHDGSLGTAHAYVDAIADAGADAVKFQTHLAAAESTQDEPFRVAFSRQDASRYDYWARTAFVEEQWRGLARHAEERGLVFLSTPFSVDALEMLVRVGIRAWKIGSGETQNVPLIERAVTTGMPILISTGMSSTDEIDRLVTKLRRHDGGLLLFQSTSMYPCTPELLGLPLIAELRRRYRVPVGLSDHSGTVFAGLGATLNGLDAIEVHITFSRKMFGPDVQASITPDELRTLVEGIRYLERARDGALDKDAVAYQLSAQKTIFSRSIVAARDLEAGSILSERDLAFKKPGGGLPPAAVRDVVGRVTRRAIARDERINDVDLDPLRQVAT